MPPIKPVTSPTVPIVTPSGPTSQPKKDIVVTKKFVPPTFELSVPDNLGHPPTSADVTVKKGLDGRTPAETLNLVKGQLTNAIDPGNQRLVETSVLGAQKAVTIAVNNAFTPGSPLANFAAQFPNATFTVCGTMSQVMPAVIRMEVPHRPAVYIKRGPAGYEPMDKMKYPIIMEAKLKMSPQGVMLKYPLWSAMVLTGPTGTISEG